MSDTSSAMAEQVLRALGLDAVATHVYLMMLTAPDAGAAEIAERLELEQLEVADALDVLGDLSLLRSGVESSSQLRPVSIERALQTLLRQQSEQLALQSNSLAVLQSSMNDLLASPRGLPGNLGQANIEAVNGADLIQSRVEELAIRARETFDVISPGGPAPKELLDAAKPADEEMARRGVRVRIIYQTAVRSDSHNLEYMKWLRGLGVETRYAAVLPPRVILIDSKIAALSASTMRPTNRALIIHEPSIVALLLVLFDTTWASADLLPERESKELRPSDVPSSQELALLRILAAGSTDDAAAKKLGVSVRTVRRMMADLMDRLGAASRFEAGHRATQRGWL